MKNVSRGNAVRDVSFQLREGEILGLAGLVGSGRTELVRLLFGADRKDRGDIFINGEGADIGSPTDAIKKGIGLVPEQRHTQGLVLPMDVKQNITLASLKQLWRSVRLPLLSRRKETTLAAKYVIATAVKTYGLGQPPDAWAVAGGFLATREGGQRSRWVKWTKTHYSSSAFRATSEGRAAPSAGSRRVSCQHSGHPSILGAHLVSPSNGQPV